MRVKSYGFSLTPGNTHVSIADLFLAMEQNNGQPDNTKANERRFYIDSTTDADFVLGLVVTVKDQRRFLELVDEQGLFRIKVNNLDDANQLMEFNFFLVNRNNGLGIYQHYHQSCSIGTFSDYLRSRYRLLTNASRDTEIQALHTRGEHSKSKEKKIRSAHAKGLDVALLTRSDPLATVLASYKEIQRLDYDFISLAPVMRLAQPLTGMVKKVRQRLTFDNRANKRDIASGIVAMLGSMNRNTARVQVLTDDDIPISIRIAEIPENFGEQEFDDVADALNELDVSSFAGHSIMRELLDTCKGEYEHLFLGDTDE